MDEDYEDGSIGCGCCYSEIECWAPRPGGWPDRCGLLDGHPGECGDWQ